MGKYMHMSNRFPLLSSLIYEEKSKISRVNYFLVVKLLILYKITFMMLEKLCRMAS